MKRLFTLLTVIASAAVLFSCGGGSSSNGGDDAPKLDGESLAITKAAGAAVTSAINTALDSLKKAPAMKAVALKAEGPEPAKVDYASTDGTLKVIGTTVAMDVTMKDYKSESDGHKLVLNGTVTVTLTEEEGVETKTVKGTIDLTYDDAKHNIVQDYKTVTDYEKGTYVTTGTVTFDGTASNYDDSGEAVDPNKEKGKLQTLANTMVDAIGSKSRDAVAGTITSNSTFTFSAPVIDADKESKTITPKASGLSVKFPDETNGTFTSADITYVEATPTVEFGEPTVTTCTLTVKNGTVKWEGVDYTFSCTGTRTTTQTSSSPQPTTVEKFSVTINGTVIPVENTF